jgi:two-component system LytT family response regulator
MSAKLRVVIADDERPARSLLAAMLRSFDDVELIGEAKDGAEAVEMIERLRPDLALLDFQMPEVDGLEVVRLVKKNRLPLIAFVTAYDRYAVQAFEVNAVDYLLKPVESWRLRETLNRAADRLDRGELRAEAASNVRAAAAAYGRATAEPLRFVPVRKKSEIALVPVEQIASVIADGELLHLFTARGEKHTITYRLKDLEARLDPASFVRLGRGILANVAMIAAVAPLPGGTYRLTLTNGQQLQTSRMQSRLLRERLLRL